MSVNAVSVEDETGEVEGDGHLEAARRRDEDIPRFKDLGRELKKSPRVHQRTHVG